MGYNISGMLIKGQNDQTIIEDLLDTKISFTGEVGFEDATTGDREENTIDILQTSSGTLIFTEFGSLYDISNFDGKLFNS